MHETAEDAVDYALPNAYALQFTGGTPAEYTSLIEDSHPNPIIEVDCEPIEDYDDFLATLDTHLDTDAENFYSQTGHIPAHFEAVGGSLVLRNFHALDKETTSDLAMYIKSLWENLNFSGDRHITIAITTDDPEAIFIGNGDLSGRVRTINLTEYE